jgi:hypothetical protein
MTIESEEGVEVEISEAQKPSRPDPVVLDRERHCISRNLIPDETLKVLYRLHRSGFKAYLCGGSVRDLLMTRVPKDFDIATGSSGGASAWYMSCSRTAWSKSRRSGGSPGFEMTASSW